MLGSFRDERSQNVQRNMRHSCVALNFKRRFNKINHYFVQILLLL